VRRGDVRIHYLDRLPDGPAPVLVVPGYAEPAEEYGWLLSALAPRRALAVSVRGRGQSDAPPTGYRWEDHVEDVEAVVEDAGLDRVAVISISRGTAYALGFALRHPDRVRALVIGDYQARHVGLAPAWAEHSLTDHIRSVPVTSRMPVHAVRGVQQESVEVPLWDRLAELRCPILLIRGGRPSSLVPDEALERYQRSLPGLEVVTITSAGHDLWSRDQARFVEIVTAFLR